ncbi:helix-turn-helix domain-containing protein [Alkalibacillus almallahensis]|uniref:helix-turn-helix domain-containing protein n=1 Tax=Alkalibacillus almallahensis TaxID=1379154 RepID=UPI00141F5048|nr:hypothetical protein [Alkalibacillus almallahensis]
MLERLKVIYPNLTSLQETDSDYVTFYINGILYGIPSDDISDEAYHLIKALAEEEPYDHHLWQQYFENARPDYPSSINHFRFIAFKQTTDALPAIEDVLNKSLIILSNQQGITIALELLDNGEEPLDFHDVIDVLSNDLDFKMMIFQSDVHDNLQEGPNIYQWLKRIVPTLFHDNKQVVLKQNDALLPFLTYSLDRTDQHFFKQSILRAAIDDEPLLETIEAVIEHQLNVSSVAKTHYMHRNTVQKRIDKFNDLTHLDIRHFDDALKAYIAIKYL